MIVKILIRSPKELKDKLQERARTIGITLNAFILQILWDWAKNNR
ncbi:MAG: toxin-antitoxin system HicB family antitoxin [Oscillospiraceae bacterium]|jgi:predicted HicB family RNase H-like nuclease|nr:toxin-antitoxin system HicB family antitoxin [Oscillospiraceae bacterium]